MDRQALHDKLEIHELLARYARGVDDNDWDLYRSVFTDDAQFRRRPQDLQGKGAFRLWVRDWLQSRQSGAQSLLVEAGGGPRPDRDTTQDRSGGGGRDGFTLGV